MRFVSLFAAGLMAFVLAPLASAEDCKKGDLRGKKLKTAQKAHYDYIGSERSMEEIRGQLSDMRAKETTCGGQGTLNYLIALIDVEEAEFPEAVAALLTVLQSTSDEKVKSDKLTSLAGRFALAGLYADAIELMRLAPKHAPDNTYIFTNGHAMLLAKSGQTEEALKLIAASYPAALASNERKKVTNTEVIYLALAERSGDEAKVDEIRAKMLEISPDYTGPTPLGTMPDDPLEILFAKMFDRRYVPRILKLPRPNYPQSAALGGIEATCDVHFDVDDEGKPINVKADCSSRAFVRSAELAIKNTRYQPIIIDGKAYGRPNIVYPLSFKLE